LQANEETLNKAKLLSEAENKKSALLKAKKEKEDLENEKLMSQLESLQNDDNLLDDLKELEKVEKKDLDQKKKMPVVKKTPVKEKEQG
jgi:hypothetical protein